MGDFNKFNKGRGGRDSGGERSFGGRPGGDRKFGGRPSFGGNRGGERSFGGGRPSDGPREMFPAVCSSCGSDCQVPFKPTGKFPVYCNACFKSQGGDNARSAAAPRFAPKKSFGDRNIGSNFGASAPSFTPAAASTISKAQFEALSSKVDRILDILIAAQIDEEVPEKPFNDTLEPDFSEVKIDKKVTNKAAPKKAKGKKK